MLACAGASVCDAFPRDLCVAGSCSWVKPLLKCTSSERPSLSTLFLVVHHSQVTCYVIYPFYPLFMLCCLSFLCSFQPWLPLGSSWLLTHTCGCLFPLLEWECHKVKVRDCFVSWHFSWAWYLRGFKTFEGMNAVPRAYGLSSQRASVVRRNRLLAASAHRPVPNEHARWKRRDLHWRPEEHLPISTQNELWMLWGLSRREDTPLICWKANLEGISVVRCMQGHHLNFI